MHVSPLLNIEEHIPTAPLVLPPLRTTQPGNFSAYSAAVFSKWPRRDDASFPLISFNRRDNLSATITRYDQIYLDSADVDFIVSNVRDVSQAGGKLNYFSGDARVSARRIQDTAPDYRAKIAECSKELQLGDVSSVRPIIDYRTR